MKYYYTYLVYITNSKSSLYGKIYYGQHTTDNLADGYIGSGRILRDYLKKYPNDYYRKILKFYNSQEELNQAEYELIKPHLGKEYCLNLRSGGCKPGFTIESRKLISENTRKAMEDPQIREKCAYWTGKPSPNKGRPSKLKGISKSEETRQRMSKSQAGKSIKESTRKKISVALKGKSRSLESREKQSKTLKGHKCYIKGKHKVWDNKELKIFHYE